MISNTLFSKLPFDIIKEILLYDTHFVVRNNNKIVCINKIPKDDFRFRLYDNVPKVYEKGHNSWSIVILKTKTYILRHYLTPTQEWEYSFLVFSKDSHTNMICSIPDTKIIY
jgi:hypothetical protein